MSKILKLKDRGNKGQLSLCFYIYIYIYILSQKKKKKPWHCPTSKVCVGVCEFIYCSTEPSVACTFGFGFDVVLLSNKKKSIYIFEH